MTEAMSESVTLRAAVAARGGALDAILARYGNEWLRVAGIAEELSEVLGIRVDVVSATLLRGEESASALSDAVGM
jgi:predicted nucleotidyltransferase